LEKAWELAALIRVFLIAFAFLVAVLHSQLVQAEQQSYQQAPFEVTNCFFDGNECAVLPTYIHVMKITNKNNASGFKLNEKLLSVKFVDAYDKSEEVQIFREKYKKRYKKALQKYIDFADHTSAKKELLPRKRIARFKYSTFSQVFMTFSRSEDDHYLVIMRGRNRIVLNRENAELFLDFLNEWDFESELAIQ